MTRRAADRTACEVAGRIKLLIEALSVGRFKAVSLRSFALFFRAVLSAGLFFCAPVGFAQVPSTAFDLREWKLNIPGPREIKDLDGYSSDYFHLNAEREMCFHLDASEKGTTPNASYVRSELRHLPNWRTGESHALSAEVRATSSLKPDKLTILQIHGMTEGKGDAPPLLRIALQDGDLFAIIKTTGQSGKSSPVEKILLRESLGESFVKIDVRVAGGQMAVSVDGEEKVRRDLGFWKFLNYFKAGCYPQATEGLADVTFRRLTAY